MLEDLDNVDWNALTHAYGKASDIPQYIRKLLSDDSDTLKKTFSHLYNCLYHQSTIYEASVTTIPFLIDLLREDHIKSKASIVRFLSHLSHGNYLKSYNLGLWDQSAHAEVAKGLSTYLNLLDDKDPMIRIQAVALLSYSPRFNKDEASLILDRLLNNLPNEEHELVTCSIIFGLGYMIAGYQSFDDKTTSQIASHIERLYTEVSNPKIRLVALLSLPRILEEKTPQYVIDELLNIFENPPYPTTPANTGLPDLFALKSLWHLDNIRCKTALEIAIQKSNDTLKTLLASSALMEWLYAEKEPNLPSWTLDVDRDRNRKYIYQVTRPSLDSENISDFQIQILDSIANQNKLWQINQNLLERYGLPATRDELRQFVAKHTPKSL